MPAAVVNPPAEEPVSLAEAKAHLRVDDDADNLTVGALIATARDLVENETGRALVTRRLALTLDGFGARVELPHPPAAVISAISYVDADGVTQVLDPSGYVLVKDDLLPLVGPAFGKTFPETRAQPNAVVVTWDAGYGAAAAVPPALRHAILITLTALYEEREGGSDALPAAAQRLINRYIVHRY